MRPKTKDEIIAIKESGRILKAVLDFLVTRVEAGITTKALAEMAKQELEKLGGEPAFYQYNRFPDVICISVNEQVVHGVPGNYELKKGDILSLDFGVKYNGMITDSATSLVVGGEASSRVRTLLKATEEALYIGIDQVKNGARVGDIGEAIQRRLLRDNLGVVEDLVGHGVGHAVHEDPEIPNFGTRGQGPLLKSGMTIAIEPMATLGRKEVFIEEDGQTISTQDKSLSAHFEHTVLVTDSGYEILTT